jgi:hypothetical protein
MNSVLNVLASWRTTLSGIGVLSLVLVKWGTNHAIDANDIPAILVAFGLVAAKDANVTGAK